MTQRERRTPPPPRRGEIYWVDFPSSLGVETEGTHPAVIIQNDLGNEAALSTIVAVVTSNLRIGELPIGVFVEPEDSGLPRPSVVHLGRLYTIGRNRLRDWAGVLSPRALNRVDRAIAVSLGLGPRALAHAPR